MSGERAARAESLAAAVGPYFRGAPERGNTTGAVTEALREAILDGVLAPASWLREDEVAHAFTVSRTPAREALRRLADEGLAVKTAHQGTVVASLSLEDVLALYVVREDLEGLAARLAALRSPTGLVTELKSCQKKMRTAARRRDVQRLANLNLDFHRAIREATANPYLDRFLRQVEHAVRRLPSTSFAQKGRPAEALDEHDAIVRAVEAGDGDAAEKAARMHMRRAREIRLAVLLGS